MQISTIQNIAWREPSSGCHADCGRKKSGPKRPLFVRRNLSPEADDCCGCETRSGNTGSLNFQRCFGLLNYRGKSRRLQNSQVREHFSIQGYLRFLQAFDETIVRETVLSDTGADSDDPESAKIAFPLSPITVCVTPGAFNGFFGLFQGSASAAKVSFRCLHNLFTSSPTGGRTACSRHSWLLLGKTAAS